MSRRHKKFISHLVVLLFAVMGIVLLAVKDDIFAAAFIGVWIGHQAEHFILNRRQYDK